MSGFASSKFYTFNISCPLAKMMPVGLPLNKLIVRTEEDNPNSPPPNQLKLLSCLSGEEAASVSGFQIIYHYKFLYNLELLSNCRSMCFKHMNFTEVSRSYYADLSNSNIYFSFFPSYRHRAGQ